MGKHLCQSLYFNEVAGTSIFLWLFKISKNTFSYRTPPVAVSIYGDTISSDFIANIKNLFICWHKFLEDTTENNF